VFSLLFTEEDVLRHPPCGRARPHVGDAVAEGLEARFQPPANLDTGYPLC
jgi:hypothetical protein